MNIIETKLPLSDIEKEIRQQQWKPCFPIATGDILTVIGTQIEKTMQGFFYCRIFFWNETQKRTASTSASCIPGIDKPTVLSFAEAYQQQEEVEAIIQQSRPCQYKVEKVELTQENGLKRRKVSLVKL